MRITLINARKNLGLTQKKVAKKLNISVRAYQYIETGKIIGKVEVWDNLEDLFELPQRQLREIEQKPH